VCAHKHTCTCTFEEKGQSVCRYFVILCFYILVCFAVLCVFVLMCIFVCFLGFCHVVLCVCPHVCLCVHFYAGNFLLAVEMLVFTHKN
jgi:hypothetical protein